MSEVGRVIWVDSIETDDTVFARVGLRMEDGRRENCYFSNVEPWGYISEDVPIPERPWIKRIESNYRSIFGDSLKKVVTDFPDRVNSQSKESVMDFASSGFESDIPFYRKLSMVDGISGYIELPDVRAGKYNGFDVYDFDDVVTDVEPIDIEPRVLLADIEVSISDEETFEETRDNGSQPINVICCYDSYEEDYVVFYYDKYDNLSDLSKIRDNVEEHVDLSDDTSIELITSSTETSMLLEFVDYLDERRFDLSSGWNWIDFDYQYLINRFDTVDGISPLDLCPFPNDSGYYGNRQMNIPGLAAFDMMDAFCEKMTFHGWRSKSLDYVSREELGVGKIEDVDINEDWKNDPEKLIGYNIVDVALTVLLDEVNDIHNFFYDITTISSIQIYDTFYEKRIVDGYVISRRGENEILPNAEEAAIPNAGGYVADAVNGRNENVGVSDLKSLYPSAIITWNISTETISDEVPDGEYVKIPHVPEPKNVVGRIQEEQIEWDWLYCSLEKEGLIPRTIKKLFEKREYEKEKMYSAESEQEENKWDRKQGATKVIMNSFYGNASSPYWRLSNKYLGDAITSCARYTLWKGEQSILDMDYEHLYSDTDSHFIKLTSDTIEGRVEELKEISAKMDEDASEIAQDIGINGKHPYLADEDLHGDDYTCMVWEPEKIYNVFMQLGTKKRYAGNKDWEEGEFYDEPEISVTGFEYKRSDSPEITAELQRNVIEMILTSSSFDEVSEYIQSVIDQIDEDHEEVRKFALPGAINKDLSEYPNRQVPRGSMYSNEYLGYEFGDGDNPFIYLVDRCPPGLPNTDVLALEWNEKIPDGFELDKEAIVERAVKKPIDDILEEVDWKFQEVRSGKSTGSMDLSTGGSNPFA